MGPVFKPMGSFSCELVSCVESDLSSSAIQRRRAIRMICRLARDVDDARYIAEVLGLDDELQQMRLERERSE